jgi:3-deoxy-D-manno-octulosonic-acid transferase
LNPLYNIGIHAYAGAASLVALRSDKVAKMRRGQKLTFDYLAQRLTNRPGCIWFHAASLGEFEQGRPMIERLRREHPQRPILLTFFSPSGYEVRKNYDQVDAVAYLPFDTPANVRRFLDIVNPSMAIFIKYEFWGNYLQQLDKRHIHTYIISSIFRPKQIFFKPWGGMFRTMLRRFTHIYVQDDASADLLASLQLSDRVTVAGDTRFDRVTDIMNSTFDMPQVEQFLAGADTRIIFGSSWEPDEDLYIPYLNSHPEIKAVIAPHEMKGDRVERLAARLTNGAVALSKMKGATDAQAIIVDSFGKLSSIYRYGNIAYIGGGFGVGIHNINEAAVYGMPVVFGPRYDKFKEAHDMIALGAAFSINSADSLTATFDKLTADRNALADAADKARKYIVDNLGATDRIYRDIFPEK